jgi:hypothetical protein
MALFRKPKSSRSLLPADAASYLSDYGRFAFAPQGANLPTAATTGFLTWLETDPAAQTDPGATVEALQRCAYSAGGWALCGAHEAVQAYFRSEAEGPTACALRDARLTFLRSLDLPDLSLRLGPSDRLRFDKLFPGERI